MKQLKSKSYWRKWKKLTKELLKDPKELAEHLMVLDLGRNEVGKVGRDKKWALKKKKND